MSEFDPVYQDATADERERAAEWDEHERAWAEAQQDTLTRDAGESTLGGWGHTVLAADSYPREHYVADERRMCGPVLVVDEAAHSHDRPEAT